MGESLERELEMTLQHACALTKPVSVLQTASVYFLKHKNRLLKGKLTHVRFLAMGWSTKLIDGSSTCTCGVSRAERYRHIYTVYSHTMTYTCTVLVTILR